MASQELNGASVFRDKTPEHHFLRGCCLASLHESLLQGPALLLGGSGYRSRWTHLGPLQQGSVCVLTMQRQRAAVKVAGLLAPPSPGPGSPWLFLLACLPALQREAPCQQLGQTGQCVSGG